MPRDARPLPLRPAPGQGELPRPRGRLRRHPAARPRRQPPLLRLRRGARGARGLQGQARARLLEVPPARRRRVSSVRIWIMAARLRTLPAAVAPVLVGTALSATERDLRVGGFVAALLGAIFIQVGTNLSNDYSDARRGADTEDRLGPVRVTAGGLVPPRQVLVATYVSFGLAVLCGVYLVVAGGPDPARHRRRLDPGRRPLHRRPAPVRLRGPRRGLRLPLLRHRRGDRLLLRPGRAGDVGGLRARGPRRAARERDPGRQQRPRPGVRPARRQAHAGRTTRSRARAYPVRTHGLRRLPDRAGCPGWRGRCRRGCCCPWCSCRWPSRSCASCAATPTGPTLNLALARTGMLQLAFCVLLSAGLLLS